MVPNKHLVCILYVLVYSPVRQTELSLSDQNFYVQTWMVSKDPHVLNLEELVFF